MNDMDLSHYHNGDHAERPWGSWAVFCVYPNAILKQIKVKPGCRLSLQSHEHREELWTVVQGSATVEIDGTLKTLSEGEVLTVPRGSLHRLGNSTQEWLTVIEIQHGTILSEQDIVRYEDDYHRAPAGEPTH